MPEASDLPFMDRAIALAMRGRGFVEPNPMVGCVLVKGGRVIGEGFHARFGQPHAEPTALADAARRGEDVTGATAYVTLEPCCHEKKKTPPCVPQLLAAKVSRVVVGALDPNPLVNGNGIRQLREAGLEVTTDVRGGGAQQLIAPFIARTRLARPYVTLKWAVSADNRVAGKAGRRVRITGREATAAVHALRGRCDAIAIGTNTLINDDPLLTARTDNPPRQPIRVVLSNRLDFPLDRRLFAGGGGDPRVLVLCVGEATRSDQARQLRGCGIEVVGLPGHDNGRGGVRFSFGDALAELARRDVTHLLVEPGPKLARGLIERRQADRAWIFRSRAVTIGEDGLVAPQCEWPVMATKRLGEDDLSEQLNPSSDVYFANAPSADFVAF